MKTIFFILFNLSAILATAQEVKTFVNDSNREFESIYWHEDGRIYSADYNNGRLYQLFSDGTVETIVTGFSNIAGGGFDIEDRFYFSGIAAGTLHRLNDDGTHTLIASGMNQPVGVLPSSDPDILYVAEYGDNSISKVSLSNGQVETWVSLNGISGPDGIIYHESGDILVANFNNNKIHRVDTDGNVSLFATLPSAGFMGYITRAGDYYYAPSINGKKIYRIDKDGIVESFAGTGTAGNEDGPLDMATFSGPNGIVANPAGDTLLITDGNRVRLITDFAPIIDAVSNLEINALSIKPNPVADVLSISFDLVQIEHLHWEVFSSKGNLILREPFKDLKHTKNEHQISVQGLTPGVYIIRITNQEGESVQQQFVKK